MEVHIAPPYLQKETCIPGVVETMVDWVMVSCFRTFVACIFDNRRYTFKQNKLFFLTTFTKCINTSKQDMRAVCFKNGEYDFDQYSNIVQGNFHDGSNLFQINSLRYIFDIVHLGILKMTLK